MGKSGESEKKEAAPTGGKPAGAPEAKKESAAPSTRNKKGNDPAPGGCHSWGCKAEAKRFNFCDDHYDHFKFGLIKKTGEPVSDYEKKYGHYLAQKSKRGAQRVA